MMSSLLAPSARSTSSSSGSMVARPVATFTTIGKNEIRNAVRIAGHLADAEPHDQDRHDRDFRDGVEADHHRIEPAIDGARPADDEAEHDAEGDREREARPWSSTASRRSAAAAPANAAHIAAKAADGGGRMNGSTLKRRQAASQITKIAIVNSQGDRRSSASHAAFMPCAPRRSWRAVRARCR